MEQLNGSTLNRAKTRALLLRVLNRTGSRQAAVRAAIDAGCRWDVIHKELLGMERAGLCEPRRVLPHSGPRRALEV